MRVPRKDNNSLQRTLSRCSKSVFYILKIDEIIDEGFGGITATTESLATAVTPITLPASVGFESRRRKLLFEPTLRTRKTAPQEGIYELKTGEIVGRGKKINPSAIAAALGFGCNETETQRVYLWVDT